MATELARGRNIAAARVSSGDLADNVRFSDWVDCRQWLRRLHGFLQVVGHDLGFACPLSVR